jgi:hypothetical protein
VTFFLTGSTRRWMIAFLVSVWYAGAGAVTSQEAVDCQKLLTMPTDKIADAIGRLSYQAETHGMPQGPSLATLDQYLKIYHNTLMEQARQKKRDCEQTVAKYKQEQSDESIYQAAMTEMKGKMDQLGYKRMLVTDFVLDARSLQGRDTKVAVIGDYRVEQGNELLDAPGPRATICLLAGDAPRGLRQFLLAQASPIGPFNELVIPDVVIMGTAVTDPKGSICLAAENGWSLHRPGIAFGSYVPDELR